ncbi:aldose epimerase family protein [Saccharicrinis sp. FJH54]|uniref:aldose epimerase family protein n=1 Tax=Saccharicrinis sp. FJH54 TaxID=3344665 RepID=UPI0035D4803D
MKTLFKTAFILTAIALIHSCAPKAPANKAGIDPQAFNKVIDGKQVSLVTLTNKNGLEMTVTNYGAKVVSLMVPDKNGEMADIVLGFNNIDDYQKFKPYFGAAIGRYGNRIANGEFTLNGEVYHLAKNDGNNHLHGGIKGFNAVVWDMKKVDDHTVKFTYVSKDGEEGYPGELTVHMTYQLTDDNEFKINYEATTDKPTVLNLTHHSYFNLHGEGTETINDLVLYINADNFTPTDSGLIPTGEIIPVAGTPMDFTTPTEIGQRIDADYEPLILGHGYDHNYVLNQEEPKTMVLAATVYDPASGRYMEVHTDEPAIQFYGGNFLDGTVVGKSGIAYPYRSALCLETQHYPDSPNKPNFPSTVLNPGETYTHTCIYKFDVK